jgi:hypothetical protein
MERGHEAYPSSVHCPALTLRGQNKIGGVIFENEEKCVLIVIGGPCVPWCGTDETSAGGIIQIDRISNSACNRFGLEPYTVSVLEAKRE